MLANTGFTAAAAGRKWSESFASPSHSTFITLLQQAHAGDATALATLTNFFRTQATPALFDPAESVDVIEFSTASQIGGSVINHDFETTVSPTSFSSTGLTWTLTGQTGRWQHRAGARHHRCGVERRGL